MKVLLHKYKDLILLLILGLVPLLWYGIDANMLITSDDSGTSLDPVALIKKRLFAWDGSVNLGVSQNNNFGSIIYYGTEALSAFLTGSVFTGQKIITIVWFLIPMLVMYYVIKRIAVFRDKPYMALFAAVLFQFNHFQQHAWRVYWRTRFSTYILLPISLLLLIDYLDGRRKLFRTSIIFGIAVMFLNGGGSPPVFGANIVMFMAVGVYFLIIHIRDNLFLYAKRLIFFIFASFIASFVFSTFWILSYTYFSTGSYSKSLETIGGLNSQLTWTDQISQNAGILNLLRNVGLPFWNPSFEVPKLFISNPVFIISSFVWPVLILISIFFARKKSEKIYILLIILLTIAGLVFTTGSHPPFREFYLFLLQYVPGFIIFRSPLYKFGNLLWFSYAILAAFSVSSIIEKLREYIYGHNKAPSRIIYLAPTVFLIFIMFWNFPIFNNYFFGWSKHLSIMEKVPQYVVDSIDWINKSEDTYGRIVLLPESNKSWRQEAYRWKYWSFGSQLLPLATNKNTLSNDATTGGFERLYLDGLYDLLRRNDPTWLDMAKMLNFRYFLLRRDFFYDLDWLPNTQPYIYEEILADNNNVEKIKAFGEWYIYRIKTDIKSDKISAKLKPVYYSTSANNLPKLFSLASQLERDSLQKSIFIQSKDSPDDLKNYTLFIMPEPMTVYLPTDTGKLELAQPKFLPNSPFYFLTQIKEKNLLSKSTTPLQINNTYLKLSQDRLAELNELLTVDEGVKVINGVSERYISLLKEMKNNLDSLIKTDNDNSKIKVQTKGLLMEERKLLKGWISQQQTGKVKVSLEKIDQTLEDVANAISVPKEQEAVLKGMMVPYNDSDIVFLTEYYKWKIPQSGLYKIYLNKNSLLLNNKSIKISVGEKSIETKITRDKESGQYVGDIELVEGEYGLQIETDGIKLSSIRQSDLFFIKEDTDNSNLSVPEINYDKINPTKFIAKISATKPFFLLLDEKYDPEWRIYIKNKFSTESLIDKHILNTLFLRQENIPHLEVNGYANAWFIDPAKYSKQGDFEIVLEYWPQRIFYVGIVINVFVLTGSLIYFLKSRTKV